MSAKPLRKRLTFAMLVASGAVASLILPASTTMASHGGESGVLTASDGTSIFVQGGSTLTPVDLVFGASGAIDASWSHDGSRAVFVNNLGEIATVRYNDQNNIWYVADATPDAYRRHPTWSGTSWVVWAEQSSGQWRLMLSPSSYGSTPKPITPADGAAYTHPDGGADERVVYQRQVSGQGAEVWMYDPFLGDTAEERNQLVVTNAGNPAISPDGESVAFVRGGDIWIRGLDGGAETQITNDPTAQDNPSWSHDGQALAFNHGGAVATAPSIANQVPTTVDGLSGLPAYRSINKNTVVRLAGASRFGTAVSVSKAVWGNGEAQSVVLSRSDDFADALGGAALSAAKQGPLLLTPPTSLDPETKAEIARVLGTTNRTVYVLGGVGAISAAVAAEIQGMGYTIERLSGSDRFATSVAIAEEITLDPDLVLAATGLDFPDALAAGAAAGSYNTPGSPFSAVVVLTSNKTLPSATQTYLDGVMSDDTVETDLYGIGGQAAAAVGPRYADAWGIVGANRYMTSQFVAEIFFGGQQVAGVAIGTDWPDALAGGALMAQLNGPLLLSQGGSATLPLETEWVLDVNSGSIDTGFVFGGTGVVSNATMNEVGKWISSTSYVTVVNPQSSAITSLESRGAKAQQSSSPDSRTPDQVKAAAESVILRKNG